MVRRGSLSRSVSLANPLVPGRVPPEQVKARIDLGIGVVLATLGLGMTRAWFSIGGVLAVWAGVNSLHGG